MLDPALLHPERVRPLLRCEFEQLIELGVFERERVELLRGVLVEMSPQGESHARISAWFAQRLIKALAFDRYDVRTHSSFPASDESMPEPDVTVTRRRPRRDPRRPSQALLLIEVSGSSSTKDRVIKTEIYAEAGVPEYWIVDLRTATVDVLTHSEAGIYTKTTRFSRGDILRPRRLRGVELAVSSIPWLPRAATSRRRVRRSKPA